MAGTGDGHRAWDLETNSTMTNGTVGDLVATNGRTLTSVQGRRKEDRRAGRRADRQPRARRSFAARAGTKVVLFAKKEADASLSALAISAGKDGVTPPM